MSGTIAYVQRQEAEQAAAEVARQALSVNQQAVQSMLIGIVKAAAGWTQIDPEFQSVIDASLAGQLVDLNALNAQISAWQAAKTAGGN